MIDRRWVAYQTEIHQLLCDLFEEEELKTLCFRLGVVYNDLEATGRANKARELVQSLGRQDQLDDLRTTVMGLRPNTAWPELPADPPTRPAEWLPAEPDPLQVYHERLVEILSGSRWRLDSRFVQLTLLLDQGPDTQDIRFAPDPARGRFQSLATLLDEIEDRAIVLLGKPGSGKTTLLRRLELEQAWAELEQPSGRTIFFMPLNAYRPARLDEPPPDPYDWLAQVWRRRNPNLPSFESLFAAGRLLLLLDGLNEMPHRNKADYQERIGAWRLFCQEYETYGNITIFSCRSLQYSAPLSSELAPVPHVQVEPLAPDQTRVFLDLHLPEQCDAVWSALASDPEQLKLFSTPFFLRLLVDQVAATDEIPAGQASLLTGFVRRTLYREIVERKQRLFAPDFLLSENDVQQVIQRAWPDAYALPTDGPLLPALTKLAFAMQDDRQAQEAAQVRLPELSACDLLDQPQARQIIEAGIQLNALDKDLSTAEITFYHQLLQEYFAARALAEAPEPARLATPWRAAEMVPSLPEALAELEVSEPLPPAPSTGWEETAVLAAAMSADQEQFVADLIPVNLPLAAHCAATPEVDVPALRDPLRQALLARIDDEATDLRARIAAAEALGELGDPRFERRSGPDGDYLLPPLVPITGGTYTLGDDDGQFDDERPAHPVEFEPFELGVFPVTNAEYALFVEAGGYENECWWSTDADRAWLAGESSSEGQKAGYRDLAQQLADMSDETIRAQPNFTPEEIETLLWLKHTEPAERERQLSEWFPEGEIYDRPAYWDDSRFNGPNQPVVGLSWFEARAYCAWLSAQSGDHYTLPAEAEWEAAARGRENRVYAYGDEYDPGRCNTFESHIRGTTPVGVYPGGYTPKGVADLSGNVWEWTNTIYQDYRYSADDGREDDQDGVARRVVRGGSWSFDQRSTRASYRNYARPNYRYNIFGFRLARRSPSFAVPLPWGFGRGAGAQAPAQP